MAMGLLLLLLWCFLLVYSIAGMCILIGVGGRALWGLLPTPRNDLHR